MKTEDHNQAGEQYTLQPELSYSTKSGSLDAGADTGVTVEVEDQQAVFWILLRELVETVVLALIIFLVIRQGVQNYRIESHSMQPNFFGGQFVLVNKLAYKLGEPTRGDVIVFHNPDNPDEDYIKRIVGLPGDTIEFRDQIVYVNGEVLDEPFVRAPTTPDRTGAGPIVVNPDHLYVMGDNRPDSRDSRSFGQLTQDLVVGQAWVRVWPFTVFGLVKHYPIEPGMPTTMMP